MSRAHHQPAPCRTRAAARGTRAGATMTTRSCRRARSSRPAEGPAHRLERIRREVLEVTLGESRAVCAGDDLAQRLMDGVGRPLRAELVRSPVDEIHIEVDIRALDHARTIHPGNIARYTCWSLCGQGALPAAVRDPGARPRPLRRSWGPRPLHARRSRETRDGRARAEKPHPPATPEDHGASVHRCRPRSPTTSPDAPGPTRRHRARRSLRPRTVRARPRARRTRPRRRRGAPRHARESALAAPGSCC